MNDEHPSLHLAPSEHCLTTGDGIACPLRPERQWIMAVTRNGHMSEHVMEYALNVAHRLGYGILAVHVDTMPLFNRERRGRLFGAAMRESAALFREKAGRMGVAVEHLDETGKIAAIVGRLCRAKKRIEFVVIDKGVRLEEILRQSPVPVFPVISGQQGLFIRTFINHTTKKGAFAMTTLSKKRHLNHCLLFGALTSGLYASVFAYQDVVMTYFSKGGLYAVLPVATVFAVSYFHGNFTSAFWSALGIEASKKVAVKRTAPEAAVGEAVVAPRPDTRPRLHLNA
jgi:hypothetical protein